MSAPHPAELELKALKIALWRWANAKTYADACQRWRELSDLIGVDVAVEESAETRKPANLAKSPN